MQHDVAPGLRVLEDRLAEALERLQEPGTAWVPPMAAPGGGVVLDVAILGAGMAGVAAGLPA